MTLLSIVLATLAGGVLSVLAAGILSLTVLDRWAPRLVSFSVGVLLAAVFLNILPEAASLLPLRDVGATVLAGIFIFFALEKTTLWRHDHLHLQESNSPQHAGMMIVIGDGLHNFVDGLLIAAAFLQDPALGWATAFAVIAHEIPQEIGDFVVLLAAGYGHRRALLLNVLSGSTAVLGGVLGYFVLQNMESAIPYLLALAAASFIYIAVADLIPLLQKDRQPLDFAVQTAMLIGGVAVVAL